MDIGVVIIRSSLAVGQARSASHNTTTTNMTQHKIFGPDIEDPIDIDQEGEKVNFVGVHNNLILERSEVVKRVGGGREGTGPSYQDRMFLTLCFREGLIRNPAIK